MELKNRTHRGSEKAPNTRPRAATLAATPQTNTTRNTNVIIEPSLPPRSVGAAGATCVGGVGVVGGRVGSVEGPVPIAHLPPLLRLLYCFNL